MALKDLKGRKVTLHDMCLRDGMHAKRHQITLEQMTASGIPRRCAARSRS